MRCKLLTLGLLGACQFPPIDSEPLVDLQLSTPEISEFTLICDVDRERWQLDVKATSWTGGGQWWWTTDGDYIEYHDVTSRKAAEDGSSDALRLRLNIVADWRDANKNASTPFLCASTPTGRFVMFDLENQVVDCEDTGPDTQWLNTEEALPTCAGA
jgi:hypothetical protein